MVFRAIKFVADAHQGQYRKGTNIPYISHNYVSQLDVNILFYSGNDGAIMEYTLFLN